RPGRTPPLRPWAYRGYRGLPGPGCEQWLRRTRLPSRSWSGLRGQRQTKEFFVAPVKKVFVGVSRMGPRHRPFSPCPDRRRVDPAAAKLLVALGAQLGPDQLALVVENGEEKGIFIFILSKKTNVPFFFSSRLAKSYTELVAPSLTAMPE